MRKIKGLLFRRAKGAVHGHKRVTPLPSFEHRQLTADEETELAKRIAKGDQEAHDELVSNNLKLVVTIVHEYMKDYSGCLDADDLFSVGVTGLLKAAPRFDPEKGAKFSTYAAMWIKNKINTAIREDSGLIHIPRDVSKRMGFINEVCKEFKDTHGYIPDAEYIASLHDDFTPRQVRRAMGIMHILSVDKPIDGKEKDGVIGDIIPDPRTKDPFHLVRKKADREELCELMKCLTNRERDVIKHRYSSDRKKTCKEIGALLGISRQAVDQTEARAIKRMQEKAFMRMSNC